MMTSNFANLAKINVPLRPVWIARGHPRAKGGWKAYLKPGVTGSADMRLAPTWAMLKGDIEDYHRAFAKQLAALDPAAVYRELGENAVLLCWCEVGRMCHRRIVAEWFEAALGVTVPELGADGSPQRWSTSAYAHFRHRKPAPEARQAAPADSTRERWDFLSQTWKRI
jgi:hypothetical protein